MTGGCYDCKKRRVCGQRAYYEDDPRQVCKQHERDPESDWWRNWI